MLTKWLQDNAKVKYHHYYCISIGVPVKPWALTSGNSYSRGHGYYHIYHLMTCFGLLPVARSSLNELSLNQEHLSPPSSQRSVLDHLPCKRSVSLRPRTMDFIHLQSSTQSTDLTCSCSTTAWPQQQSADSTVQKDSLALLLTNCWRAMSDAATCPHLIPLFVQEFQYKRYSIPIELRVSHAAMAAWPLQALVVARWGPFKRDMWCHHGPLWNMNGGTGRVLRMAPSHWTSQ